MANETLAFATVSEPRDDDGRHETVPLFHGRLPFWSKEDGVQNLLQENVVFFGVCRQKTT